MVRRIPTEQRIEAWREAMRPRCAQDNVQEFESESDVPSDFIVALAFEGTEPDQTDCTHATQGIVATPTGIADFSAACLESVEAGTLDARGSVALLVVEVDCAMGSMGSMYLQVWQDAPQGPVQLKVPVAARDGDVVDVSWEPQPAGGDALVVRMVDDVEALHMGEDEQDERELRWVWDGARFAPAPSPKP